MPQKRLIFFYKGFLTVIISDDGALTGCQSELYDYTLGKFNLDPCYIHILLEQVQSLLSDIAYDIHTTKKVKAKKLTEKEYAIVQIGTPKVKDTPTFCTRINVSFLESLNRDQLHYVFECLEGTRLNLVRQYFKMDATERASCIFCVETI